jgi:hypothetical protein
MVHFITFATVIQFYRKFLSIIWGIDRHLRENQPIQRGMNASDRHGFGEWHAATETVRATNPFCARSGLRHSAHVQVFSGSQLLQLQD